MPRGNVKFSSSCNSVPADADSELAPAPGRRLLTGVAAQDALASLFDENLTDEPDAVFEEIEVAPHPPRAARSPRAPERHL